MKVENSRWKLNGTETLIVYSVWKKVIEMYPDIHFIPRCKSYLTQGRDSGTEPFIHTGDVTRQLKEHCTGCNW